MKTSIFKLLLISFLFLGWATASAQMIKTKAPKRAKGQTDVLRLAIAPIPTVRVAFIGLGMRGPGAVERMTHIPGVEIVALCDMLETNTKSTNEILTKAGHPKAQEFFGDENAWRKVTALPNVDLIYIATDWKHHAKMGVQAMKDGKNVAIEVPGAMTMDEIWDLINTSEKTRKHCMMLENCVYDFFELTTLNMAQQGLFGEILHAEGSYIHGLQPYWGKYWDNWRMDYNRKHRGDIYATHGMGPACQALNIHRGDKMNYLVSMDTKAVGNPAYIKEKTGEDVKDFRNGDHTMTMIRTEKGKTIQIQHDVTSPRPYSRMYQLSGTKGFANKYPVEGYALDSKIIGTDVTPNHENLNAHSFVPAEVKKALMEKYKHPIVKGIEEQAKKVGGHGGMDFIMDYRLIYCLQNGLPLDMDVYDLAEWSCLAPLTEISLDNNSAPVEIPDFTRGGWNKLKGLEFSK
ncbi:MAG TPA: Gfo/Idh/MocA family oxidoreductase [Flavobacterium sp.]|jgi:predicted dehydrogenase|uniref:Gfo/Idh/MocA family protein n=1 Tax=Flavobacterium sp. TaxID=239 RepID=UPI001B52CED1|nr:Gfo/Idh/MocA family oxidoreductase [Flavobacterium sp.]MBP6147009.1 Gfo/Idh/MocA family oxidoreductase [Flavobacterium sp.]MBP7318271.1 Gfo/Idh/MocA family oxidoreductase [Flavobacterium sp.]MBP7396225.1 Gfo/Idh/MocA family oxidoreductase [Flavobacterium sp.]MBP8886590.1 Gfo/Idh/MocA family oxidoreductase [Flavobacterium sp.]HRM11903.1 Gfo/Idh/MocA family oxidoreductase [Flavobacterium sp.]